jgi:hypothetical protein
VLPYTHHSPARVFEQTVCFRITLAVASDLLAPELLVSLRGSMVIGTAVPETAIQEHSDAGSGKHQVSGSPD